jgi:hypothetical protein
MQPACRLVSLVRPVLVQRVCMQLGTFSHLSKICEATATRAGTRAISWVRGVDRKARRVCAANPQRCRAPGQNPSPGSWGAGQRDRLVSTRLAPMHATGAPRNAGWYLEPYMKTGSDISTAVTILLRGFLLNLANRFSVIHSPRGDAQCTIIGRKITVDYRASLYGRSPARKRSEALQKSSEGKERKFPDLESSSGLSLDASSTHEYSVDIYNMCLD